MGLTSKPPSEMDLLDAVPNRFDIAAHIEPTNYKPEWKDRIRPDQAHEVVADLLTLGHPELAAIVLMAYTEKMAQKNYQGMFTVDYDQFEGEA